MLPPALPKPENRKKIEFKKGDTLTGNISIPAGSEKPAPLLFDTQYSNPIEFRETMIQEIEFSSEMLGADKLTGILQPRWVKMESDRISGAALSKLLSRRGDICIFSRHRHQVQSRIFQLGCGINFGEVAEKDNYF